MTPTVVVRPHVGVVEPTSVGSSSPKVAVGPIPGVLVVLVILADLDTPGNLDRVPLQSGDLGCEADGPEGGVRHDLS